MAEPFPWSWSLPAVVVTAATAGLGALRYPDLPARIPVHFAHGVADRTVPSTIGNAFLPVGAQIFITAVLAATAALALVATRTSPAAKPSPTKQSPGQSSPAQSSSGQSSPAGGVLARALLFLAACFDLALFFVAAPIWRGDSSLGRGPTAGIIAAIMVGLLGLLGGIVYAAVQARAGTAAASGDDSHWIGFIYANREDRSLLVPKRHGIGWTLNLGRPAGWVILGIVLAIPVVGTVLAAVNT